MARLTDTISGPIATFRTPGKQDIRSLKVHFAPVQEGSGDPSPENVREIEGLTGTEVYHSGADISNSTILPIDWTTEAGTVYGGYVDLVTGEVWETCKKISITQTMSQWNSWGKSLVYNSGIMGGSNKRKAGTVILCDGLTPIGGTVNPQQVTSTDEIRYYGVNVTYPQYLFMANPDQLTIQEWRSWLTTTYPSVHISFELETPVLIATLTPTQLKTLRGTNNIWSNANGNVDVEYDFAESREMLEARKRVAGYSPWKLMWHNSFDKYQIRQAQTGSVVTVMDDGKWLKAVSNGQNKNSTGIYMNDRFLYNDVKDKLCRITYTIECDQSVEFDGTNTFGNITLGLLNTKTTPSTTAASTERVSKVDIVKQDTFIGHHSVEFVPSELFADLTQADYFGWNLGFRSSIDGITIRITQLDFEVKK